MKLAYCLAILLCPYFSNAAQPDPVKPLKIGDQVPDVFFNTIINYPLTESRLSHFKKRAILVDFWTTGCGACIQKFPLLDSMQKAYPDDLVVLLVNAVPSDSREKVSRLLKRLADNNRPAVSLPVIIGDTIMKKLFPFNYVPHYAWLDSNLKLIAFSGYEETTGQKLEAFAKGQPISFEGTEDLSGFKFDKPLFTEGNGGNGKGLLARSTFSRYIYGLATANYITKNSNGKVTQVMMTNQPLVWLIERAYNFFKIRPRIHFPDSCDEALLTDGQPLDKVIANSYTYELITPAVSRQQAMRYLQEDLKRFFGYTAEIRKIKTPCYFTC